MTTAEKGARPAEEGDRPAEKGDRPAEKGDRRWAWAGLAAVLAGALGLRLWGVGQGLPYAYNLDEADHFVPKAAGMFDGSLNPHYFANPPAFTYLLHGLFAIAYGGAEGMRRVLLEHPGDPYLLARVAAAVLGTAAVWLLYLVGARLLGRGAGLLAAAIEAVAFLPVFYAHLALNDVPTLAPLTLSLVGTAGVLRRGRPVDHLLAGLGLGLACATKYTAGIVLVPYLGALAAVWTGRRRERGRTMKTEGPRARARPRAGPRFGRGSPGGIGGEEAPGGIVAGMTVAALAALGGFVLGNPYSVLDFHDFQRELAHQSSLSAEARGKLGAPRDGGLAYYLWTLTWGLGWLPALAALGGAITVWWRERALGWVLVPGVVAYLAFMGVQGRYFGRWLLPVFPLLCLLGALFAVQLAGGLAGLVGRARGNGTPGWVRGAIVGVLAAGLLAQGLIHSVHAGLVLSRADTRNSTRAWMVGHIPAGGAIVVEPVAPDRWGERWNKYPSLLSRISPDGAIASGKGRIVGIEDYELTLSPALVGYYEAHGYCWVVSGSTEAGRAYADPRAAKLTIAYYRTLARRGMVVYHASPYGPGAGRVAFDFDWSFDYYPLAYSRPGPAMTIYRLHGGRCGGGRPLS
ncbi:MAG TPA: glycosyltransferase family 39 protein [Solirubrobacteraceae bacterium]|nr:glycosyltransferase family 39 protein [Solirubrobacteraceae bacterium]